MRKIIVLILLITAVGGYSQKDQKASDLLDQVSAKTKGYKSIKADFSYKMQNTKAKINEEKQGTLLLSGDKYKMQASGQTVICVSCATGKPSGLSCRKPMKCKLTHLKQRMRR